MASEVIEGLEGIFLGMKVANKRLAVVGNAVFKNKHGNEIDLYDEVIRFNNYVLDRYTEWVGHKVTWWCTHPYVPSYYHNHKRSLCHRKYKEYKVDGIVFVPAHDYWQEYRDKYFKILSAGMTILLILDKLGVKADVYGFDNFATGHYWNPSHKRSKQHQPLYEKEIQEKLTHITFKE
jgi:hypothetical protein